ncbi:hypothetical protein CALCODRAFT_200432 [Calocera cornea HHB12733]|uniref:Uncharacterized protein n=1 Tax=Calocera cornea HHB12733 TaxID=1353952 RepID=A0A165HH38_9BASI|nr:hypothetical protein CALCODRAFT_200432 [Calocera cornea HHB12733]
MGVPARSHRPRGWRRGPYPSRGDSSRSPIIDDRTTKPRDLYTIAITNSDTYSPSACSFLSGYYISQGQIGHLTSTGLCRLLTVPYHGWRHQGQQLQVEILAPPESSRARPFHHSTCSRSSSLGCPHYVADAHQPNAATSRRHCVTRYSIAST